MVPKNPILKRSLKATLQVICCVLLFGSTSSSAQTFSYKEFLSVGSTGAAMQTLYDSIHPCTSTPAACSYTYTNRRLEVKMDLGDNYDFGSSTSWTANYGIEITGHSSCSGPTGTSTFYGLAVSTNEFTPEKILIIDLDSFLVGAHTFVINISGSSTDPLINAAMRLRVTFKYDMVVEPIDPPALSSAPIGSGSRMTFDWTAPCPGIKNYEFQLLRLYNYDEANQTETAISANVDWDKALTIETNSSQTDLTLTMAEERGYYIWRVRAIGNVTLWGANSPDNWGAWSAHGSYTSGNHNISGAAGSYLFFYNGFDNDRNWNYSRSFVEGDNRYDQQVRIGEKITYANGLQQVKQEQVRNGSNNQVLANQTVYDYTGRPALKSMVVPVNNKNELGYEEKLMKHNGNLFRDEHFDANDNFRLPKKVDDNNAADDFYYYSDNNTAEPNVPPAEGYPYARTLFYEDATGRVLEEGGIGYTHRVDTFQLSQTTKTFYNATSRDELVRIFGDEAPAASSVYKKITIDVNQTASLEYVDEEGRVIATALTINGRNLYSQDEDSMRGSLRGTPTELEARFDVLDSLDYRVIPSYTKFSDKSITIVEREGKWVGLNYELHPGEIEDLCSQFCKTCDYYLEITVFAHDDTVRIPFYYWDSLIPPQFCSAADTLEWDTLLYFPKGRYTISKRIKSHNTDPTSGYPQDLYKDIHAERLETIYDSLFTAQVQPYIDLIDAGQLNMLYSSLGIDTAAAPAILEDLDGTTRQILYGCDSLSIPIRICFPYTCPTDGSIDFWGRFEEVNPGPHTTDGDGRLEALNYKYTPAEFNEMITNMIDDGYDCDSLWGCWESMLQNYTIIKQAYTDGGAHRTLDLSKLFLECVGYRIVGGTLDELQKYGDPGGMLPPNSNSDPGYLSHAYAFIYYEDGSSPACEALYGGIPFTLGYYSSGNPWTNATWFEFMKCIESYPYASGLDPIDPYDHATAMTDSCEAQCDLRRLSFIEALVEEFHQDSIYVENDKYYLMWDSNTNRYVNDSQLLPAFFDWQVCWGEIECLADILVNRCKEDCELTVQEDGMGNPIAVGDSLELIKFQQALIHPFLLDLPDQYGDCPNGYEKLSYTTCSHIQPVGGTIPGPIANLLGQLNTRMMTGQTDTILPANMPQHLMYMAGGSCEPLPSDVGIIIDSTGFRFVSFSGGGYSTFNGCSYAYNDFYNSGAGFTYNATTGKMEVHFPGGVVVSINCIEWCNLTCEEIYNDMADLIVNALQMGGQVAIDLAQIGGGAYSFKSNGECWPADSSNYGLIIDHDTMRLVYYPDPDDPETYTVLCSEFINPWEPGEGNGNVYYDTSLKRLVTVHGINGNDVLGCFELCCEDEIAPSSGGGTGGNCDYYKSVCFKWDTIAQPDTVPFVFRPLTCEEIVLDYVRDQLSHQSYEYKKKKIDSLAMSYATNCEDPHAIDDYFWLSFPEGIHHYTLYYYDRAGNLMKTVPPKGVDKLDLNTTGVRSRQVAPEHTHVTDYEYNSNGQLIRQNTPDGGETHFYYDSKGQLRFSQNAQQKLDSTYAYTLYDPIGRIIEVGLAKQDYRLDSLDLLDSLNSGNFSAYPSGNRTERTITVYTTPVAGLTYLGQGTQAQRFLLNRVSHTYTDEDGDTTTHHDQIHTYYSYDPHGNVEWMAQELPYFGRKYMAYSYDLASGNVLQVNYQEGYVDQFYHRYQYDADNRIVIVETSTDGVVWDRDAAYSYWKHGPLKRVELGEDKVQGLDHAYTIQGWLKGVNHPSLQLAADPGDDGDATASNEFARDGFGMILNYYDDDFDRSASVYGNGTVGALAAGQYRNLYNGNINNWVSNTYNHENLFNPDPDSVGLSGNMTARKFKYDVLNRLLWSEFKDYDSGWQDKDQYYSSYEYDPNGNIVALKRNSYLDQEHTVYTMDSIMYTYQAGTNRLIHIYDSASHFGDIHGARDYTYDAIGNLTSDSSVHAYEALDSVHWNMYKKVQHIIKPQQYNNIQFRYDAAGNRVMKIVKNKHSVSPGYNIKWENEWNVYYYVRDAQGNTMAVYTRQDSVHNGDTIVDREFVLEEQAIYGSKRLGLRKGNGMVTGSMRLKVDPNAFGVEGYAIDSIKSHISNLDAADTNLFSRQLGLKQYELTDHLGNVRAVVSDYKESTWGGGSGAPHDFEPGLLAINDYNPFGSTMLSRTYNSPEYRYGYNGMEKDDEVKEQGNSLDFGARLYDSRLGRWLSVDPQERKQPGWSAYKAFLDNPVLYVDPDGETEYITIITQNEKTGETTIEQQKANKVMTDGVKHEREGLGDTWSFENYYYDYRTVTLRTIGEDGKTTETTTTEIIYSNGVKDADYVWFGGNKSGDTKIEDNFAWVPEINDIGGLVIYGSASSSEDSPGTRTSGEVWGSFDFAEFSSTMGLIMTAAKTRGENTLGGALSGTKTAGLANKVKSVVEYNKKHQYCQDCQRVFDESGNVVENDGAPKDTINYEDHE